MSDDTQAKRKYRPRISVDLRPEQSDRLRELIPWGYMSRVYSLVIDDLIEIMEAGGETALAALLARRLKLGAYLKDADGNLIIDKLDITPKQYSKLTGVEKSGD